MLRIGGEIKITGPPSAFDQEFKDMEDKLDRVREILKGSNVSADDINDIKSKLDILKSVQQLHAV